MRTPKGVWVIAQLSSATAAVSSLVGTALATVGIVGYGPRIPANMLFNSDQSVNLGVLDRHRAYSQARGKLFKPRVIWGKYTPTWAMGTRISGFAGPAPFLSGGMPNTTFEAAVAKLAAAVASWAAPKPDVVEFDCGWYSLEYSELYFGPEIQNAYGRTRAVNEASFVTAHQRLIDIYHSACSPIGLPVGFGLSGHGPITNISGKLAEHAATKSIGEVFVQANGWDQNGEWGGGGESGQDASVWAKIKGKVTAALQDISAKAARNAAAVKKMWDNARTLQSSGVFIVYVEQYYYQWDGGRGSFHTADGYAEFIKQIGLFVPSVIPGGGGGGGHEEELAALRAQLAELQAQEPALTADRDADQVALGNAQSALQAAQAEATASVAALADLESDIADVEAQIKALGG